MLELLHRLFLRLLVVACRPPRAFGSLREWWAFTDDMAVPTLQALLVALTKSYFHPKTEVVDA